VWVLVAVLAVVGGLFLPPEQRLTAIPLLFAGAILTTFVIQLAIQRKEGFVTRVMASIGGAVIILAVATVVVLVL
jgi:drug/metabolite transporter superfamily protein YnfA